VVRSPERNGSGGGSVSPAASNHSGSSRQRKHTAARRQARPKPRHFELYRFMHSKKWPGEDGSRVCTWGQASLGAAMSPPLGARQVGNLIADMKAWGWITTERRKPGTTYGEGGYRCRGWGGNRTVLQLDLVELDELERAVNAQLSGHMPWCPGQETPEESVSAAQRGSPANDVSSVRLNPTELQLEPSPRVGGESEGGEHALLPAGLQLGGCVHAPQFFNEHGRRVWVPAEVYRPVKAKLIAANPLEGLSNAERYLARCQARDQRRGRMREVGRSVRARIASGELDADGLPIRRRRLVPPAAMSLEQRRQLAALEAAFPGDFPTPTVRTGTSRQHGGVLERSR
jgi:hypothetical protein